MSLFHNKYSLDSACEICEGVIRHQPWCVETNANVLDAFKAVLYGVDEGDEARLAGMGVTWERGKGKCAK